MHTKARSRKLQVKSKNKNMAKIVEIAFTAYGVTDIKKSRAFYEGVLGLTPSDEYGTSGDWIEYNIGAGTLGIGKSDDWKPSEEGASIALEVDDFDTFVERNITAKKIPVKMGPFDFPSCKMVVVLDPDKNRVTIHQRKKK